MQFIDKVKITDNWMVSLKQQLRDILKANKGDFITFLKQGEDIIIKVEKLDDDKKRYEAKNV